MDNNVVYGLLIGLIIVAMLLIFQGPSEEPSVGSTKENFTLDDACEEMFHIPGYHQDCQRRIRSSNPDIRAGVIEAHKKYQKNKQDHVDLPEEVYHKHMIKGNNLSKYGKCRTIFWNDEDMAESCAFKPNGAVNALHTVYWQNRFNNVQKSPVEYQAFLNASTELIRREQNRFD